MADDNSSLASALQSAPNFVNTAYATPEQLASLRKWADSLQGPDHQFKTVHRWTQGVSNMVNALMGGYASGQADKAQSNSAVQNATGTADLLRQQQAGQPLDPDTVGRTFANPMASPEQRALIAGLMRPEATKDVYGRPGYQSPAGGVNAAPVKGPYTPGNLIPQSAEGVSTTTPSPAPQPVSPGNINPQGGAFGGLNFHPAGWNGPGDQAPAQATAPNGAPNTPLTLDQLFAKGQEFAAKRAFSQGSAEAQTNVAKQDIDASASAPAIKRAAGVMLDDLKTHGDKMTFGPTAEWSNNVKKIAANYAPGLMKDQLEGLASADSFDKMSAQLTSMLAKGGGGTDAQLFNSMKSVPGSHNSKEGAEALLKMVTQVADQQQALRQATAGAKDAASYEAARNDFYKNNPIVNPITGNPIQVDLEKDRAPAGYKILKVH